MPGSHRKRTTPTRVEAQVQANCAIEPGVRRPSMQSPSAQVIVLVDDSSAARNAVCNVLEAYGYTVLSASDGRSALALCEGLNAPPDLLLIDLGMPDVGGAEVVQELARVHALSRVLLMSGHTDDETTDHMLQSCDVIRKPFTSGQLVRRVRDVLKAPSLAPRPQLTFDQVPPPPDIRVD